MEPARTIIAKVGGARRASEITGTSLPAPYRWQSPKEKGGTGGSIPQRHHRAILEYARQNEIALTADDFLLVEEC